MLLLAILIRILVNPFSNVLQKKLTVSGNDPLWVNFVSFLLLALVCIFPALKVDWSAFGAGFWIYCSLAGIFSAFGNGFLVKALQSGDLSVLGPVNSYKSVVSMILGIFLLGEMPGLWGIAGMALIIFGSYFVLDTMPERFSWKSFRRKEIQYRLWAMFLTAIEAILIKQIIVLSNVMVSFIVWCDFGMLFSLIILLVFGIQIKRQYGIMRTTGGNLNFILLAVSVGLMQLTTNFVFDRMNVGYALALFQLSSIVSIWFGYALFREKHIGKKLVGAAIMIAGSVIIILME